MKNRLLHRVQRYASMAVLFRETALEQTPHPTGFPVVQAVWPAGEETAEFPTPSADEMVEQTSALPAPSTVTRPPAAFRPAAAVTRAGKPPVTTSPPPVPVTRPPTAVGATAVSPPVMRQPAPAPAPATPPTPSAETESGENDTSWRRLQNIFGRHQERMAEEETQQSTVSENPPTVQTARSPQPVSTPPAPARPLPVAPPPSRPAPPGFHAAKLHQESGGETAVSSSVPETLHKSAVVQREIEASPVADVPRKGAAVQGEAVPFAQTETAAVPTPAKTETTAPQPAALPLEAIWPVQRQTTPITTPQSAQVQRAPAELVQPAEPVQSAELVQSAEPIVELPAAEAEVVRHTLSRVSSGQPTDSSVELVLPRRPRPTAAPSPTTSPGKSVQRQPGEPSAKAEPAAPAVVQTEIGPLPTDLWQILGQEPPTEAGSAAGSVMRASETAESPTTPTQTVQRDITTPAAATSTAKTDHVAAAPLHPLPVAPQPLNQPEAVAAGSVMRASETAESPTIPTQTVQRATTPAVTTTSTAKTDYVAAAPSHPLPVAPQPLNQLEEAVAAGSVMRAIETAESPTTPTQTVQRAITTPTTATSTAKTAVQPATRVAAQPSYQLPVEPLSSPPLNQPESVSLPAVNMPDKVKPVAQGAVKQSAVVTGDISPVTTPTVLSPSGETGVQSGWRGGETAVPTTPPVMRQVEQAMNPNSPHETTSDEDITGRWDVPVNTWVAPPDIQREEVAPAPAPATPSTDEKNGAEKTAEVDIDDLARRVYKDLKRRLVVEWERVRGRF